MIGNLLMPYVLTGKMTMEEADLICCDNDLFGMFIPTYLASEFDAWIMEKLDKVRRINHT